MHSVRVSGSLASFGERKGESEVQVRHRTLRAVSTCDVCRVHTSSPIQAPQRCTVTCASNSASAMRIQSDHDMKQIQSAIVQNVKRLRLLEQWQTLALRSRHSGHNAAYVVSCSVVCSRCSALSGCKLLGTGTRPTDCSCGQLIMRATSA